MIHPSHHPAAKRAGSVLSALTALLLLVWMAPTPPGVQGIANYLPLHTLLETAAIAIAVLVFAVGWHTYRQEKHLATLLLACGFLGVGLLDFSHTLSYAGMPHFVTPSGPEKAIYFWLAARTLAAAVLLAVAFMPWNMSWRVHRVQILWPVLAMVLALNAWVLYAPHTLPATFVPGVGLTPLKIAFEYGLVAAYLLAALQFARQLWQPRRYNAVGFGAAAYAMALSEVCFTLYGDVTDVYNLLGHVFKTVAYLYLYRALFVDAIERPYEMQRETQQSLEATLNAVPDLLFELDEDGRYLAVHARRADLLAAPQDSLLGRTVHEVLGPEAAQACMAALAEAGRQGYAGGYQLAIDIGGETRWFELSVSRKGDAGGAMRRFLVISRDITDRKRDLAALAFQARRSEVLLSLPAVADTHHEQGFLQYGIELAERLTDSQIAFIHFVNPDQESIELVTWSRDTLAHYCRATHDTHYPVSMAGIWADALRQRRPVVINDYATATGKHGLPSGHAHLERLISLPVMESGKVTMMAGVGNKATPYTDTDVETVQLVANAVWGIARQRRAAAALLESEHKLAAIVNQVPAYIFIKDAQMRYQFVNESVCQLLGVAADQLLGRQAPDIWDGPTSAHLARSDARVLLHGERVEEEFDLTTRDGRLHRTFYGAKVPMRQTDGSVNAVLSVYTDITERRQSEERMRQLTLAVAQSPNPIIITNLQAEIQFVNEAFTRVSGYSAEEALGRNPRFLKSGLTPPNTYVEMWTALGRGEPWQGELINRRKDGQQYHESALIYPVRDERGDVAQYLALKQDITERKLAEARIQALSNFDQLTGLPNRAQLSSRFQQALRMARRSGQHLALLFLNLDHFKNVNDSLGHSVGDLLLMEVATRLKAHVRDQDTLARLGGDDFVLLMPDTEQNGAAQMAAALIAAVARPIELAGQAQEVVITTSIGIAVFPVDGDDFETLFKSADTALYRAKEDRRNDYRFFTPQMQQRASRALELSSALRQALARQQLHLHYQPQVSLRDGRVVGVEVLLRWQHPQWGNVSPAEFIPIAEDNGQIIEIGEWVLRTALVQHKAWRDAGLPHMVLAVNLSAVQFRQPMLSETVLQLLSEVGLPPSALELELTEAVAMDNPKAAVEVMDGLHRRGIRMSIDDFGTGYSSLSYLKRFKVYKLKIDQSFVRDVATNTEDQAIVAAIVQMAHSLGMQTIAEGVETEEQRAFLRQCGCDEVQGYLYSRPLPPEALERFVRTGAA